MRKYMSENQNELISLIRESGCPERTLKTATGIIIDYLKKTVRKEMSHDIRKARRDIQ